VPVPPLPAPPLPAPPTVAEVPRPAAASGPPGAPHVVARLAWLTGSRAGLVDEVPADGVWIGREPPAQLVVRDVGVSRQHLWVGIRDGELVALDEKSSNGTFVAGERIVRHALRPGDVVTLARESSFRFDG
jgi:hypothetical protein